MKRVKGLIGVQVFALSLLNVFLIPTQTWAADPIDLEYSTGTYTTMGKVELGALASRSASTPSSTKNLTPEGEVSPFTLRGTDSRSSLPYSYETDREYSGANLTESIDVTVGNSLSSASKSNSASFAGRNNVIMLKAHSTTLTTRYGGNNYVQDEEDGPYMSIFGPEIWSEPFEGTTNKSVSFDWAARNVDDDYEIYAFLVRISSDTGTTCENSNGVNSYGLAAPTTTHTIMAYGRGFSQSWTTASAAIPSNGCYRFRFVAGTYDRTGGRVVGAELFIDNTVEIGLTQTINFPSISDRNSSVDRSFNVGASSRDAANQATGLSLTYTSNTTSICSVNSAGIVTVLRNGGCSITASSGASGSYAAATSVTRTFTQSGLSTITYNSNSASSGSVPTDSTRYSSIENVTVLGNTGNLLRSGFSFGGWNTAADGSGTTYAPGDTLLIAANTILYAFWEAPRRESSVTYSYLRYDSNGTLGTIEPQVERLGSQATLWKNPFKREGYEFIGWNTKADGSGTNYQESSNFNFLSQDLVLFANWRLIKTTPIISWTTPAPIISGEKLSAQQLSATANVPGVCIFTPSLGATLEVGKFPLKCQFVPTDSGRYNTAEKVVEIEVLPKPSITWGNPAPIKSGTALSATQLNATSNISGQFTYAPQLGSILEPGRQKLSVVFKPQDSRISSISGEVEIEVMPALSPRVESITLYSGESGYVKVNEVTNEVSISVKAIGVGLKDASISQSRLLVTANPDFSGKSSVLLTVTDEGRTLELKVDVLVNPSSASGATHSLTSIDKSLVRWNPAGGATGYRVVVNETTVCATASSSCVLSIPAGPLSKVSVVSEGRDGTFGKSIASTYVNPPEPLVLTSVNFGTGKSSLSSAARERLRSFASRISPLGLQTLSIQGHTDSRGGVDNQRLSQARAEATREYLASLLSGVTVEVSGKADLNPVASNDSQEGRAKNRRAVVIIP